MTYGEIKETEAYINAEDIEVCVNGEEPIDEEYFYVDGFCILDDLLVIGTGNMADGTLHIDLVCTNWDKRFEPDWIPEAIKNKEMMIDYFKEAIISKDTGGIRPDIAELINADINNYRDHMIKQYNGDIQRATDEFCFKKFLNEYSTAINIFELHREYNCKRSFNRHISYCWEIVNGNEELFQEKELSNDGI